MPGHKLCGGGGDNTLNSPCGNAMESMIFFQGGNLIVFRMLGLRVSHAHMRFFLDLKHGKLWFAMVEVRETRMILHFTQQAFSTLQGYVLISSVQQHT